MLINGCYLYSYVPQSLIETSTAIKRLPDAIQLHNEDQSDVWQLYCNDTNTELIWDCESHVRYSLQSWSNFRFSLRNS